MQFQEIHRLPGECVSEDLTSRVLDLDPSVALHVLLFSVWFVISYYGLAVPEVLCMIEQLKSRVTLKRKKLKENFLNQ